MSRTAFDVFPPLIPLLKVQFFHAYLSHLIIWGALCSLNFEYIIVPLHSHAAIHYKNRYPDNIATVVRQAYKSAYKLLRLSTDLVTATTDHA